MVITHAKTEDLPDILMTYAWAREFMKRTGNPNQWKDTNPTRETVEEDIREGRNYVIRENGELVGVFACIPGVDPTYLRIEDGQWLNDGPYVTIHRIAGNGKARGVLEAAVRFASSLAENIRIDTHEDNKVMQHLLKKNGFTRCGIIHLLNGDPRIAYQKETKNTDA